MAFIDEFNKLIVKKGQQQKITNKDKAIIDLANEVVNSDKLSELKAIWFSSNGSYTKLQSVTPEGYKPQVFNANFSTHYDKVILSKSDSDVFDNTSVIGEISYSVLTSAGNVITQRDLILDLIENFKFKRFGYKSFTSTDDSTHTPNTPDGYLNIWIDSDPNNTPDIAIQANTNSISD